MAVNIVDTNTNGEESPSLLYQKMARLSVLHYQCSKTSTSKEVSSVFERAIHRQKGLDPVKHKCLVFMDEAGLPEEEKESLKVLHYYLEGHMSQAAEVGFVAITNHVLDAAKSNRCVSLLRQDPSPKEMLQIAEGVLYNRIQGTKLVDLDGQKLQMTSFATKLCEAYKDLFSLRDFDTFYGLRDFIYFLKSLKHRSQYTEHYIEVTSKIIVHALERNFNGVSIEDFELLVKTFLAKCHHKVPKNIKKLLRSSIEVVSETLLTVNASETRYPLIIDECADDSILRILNSDGLLELSKNSLFKLSSLSEDANVERLSLVSGVKFAASKGSKVVLSRTDSVNESFYDLFNQNFRRVKNRDGKEQLFANIAVGGISRRCPVSTTFQCVVHVSTKELPLLPAPFLNRFEKFRLSPKAVLQFKLKEPTFLKCVITRCKDQVEAFASVLELCGYVPSQTVETSILEMLSKAASTSVPSVDRLSEESKTFAEHFIAFALTHLQCDLSPRDFESIVEYGKLYFRFSESEALSELLEKNGITSTKDAFEDCIYNRHSSSMVSTLIEMLSELVISRKLIFKLLELATPEEIFAKREILPQEIVAEYFNQSHFGIEALLQEMKSMPDNQSNRYIVHTRSDVDILRIPRLCAGEKSPEKLNMAKKYFEESTDSMIVDHLDMMRDESSLRVAIESWSENSKIDSFLLFVDMNNQAAFEMVNFARCCFDQISPMTDKYLVLILHYPPTAFKSSSFYPSLFVGGWNHSYLNSIFSNAQSTDLKKVIQKACTGFEDYYDLRIESMVESIMTETMKSLASYDLFYPDQVSTCSNRAFHHKHELLNKVLSKLMHNQTVRSILCTKFCEVWTENNLTLMLKRASWNLKKGTTQLGLTRCLHSIMKDAMRTFCLYYLQHLNQWRNFDLLLSTDPCKSVDTLLNEILVEIPGLPFAELILQQSDQTAGQGTLKDLPRSPTLEVNFPFFLMISRLLDEILECALMSNDDSQNGQVFTQDVASILYKAMAILRTNGTGANFGHIALKVVTIVSSHTSEIEGESLFKLYLKQFIGWRLCCKETSLAAIWFVKRLEQEDTDKESTNNLLRIHVAAKRYEMSLIRLATASDTLSLGGLPTDLGWSEVKLSTPDADLPLGGLDMARSLCSRFGEEIPELDVEELEKQWLEQFPMFLDRLNDICGDETIVCEETTFLLRLCVFFYTLKENASEASTYADCISTFYDGKSVRQNCDTNISYFAELINLSKEDNGSKKMWMEALLKELLSPQILSNTVKCRESDLRFVMNDLQSLDHQNIDQLTLTLLRNACIQEATEELKVEFGQPDSIRNPALLSTSTLELANRFMECDDISNFSEEGVRLNVPHFIPSFILAGHNESDNIPIQQVSTIGSFFANYVDTFPNRPLCDAVFQIILQDIIQTLEDISSEQVLRIFLERVELESSLNRQEQTRLRRLQSNGEHNDFVGSPVGILIVEAYLICFIYKVSYEFGMGESVSALDGVYSELGWSVLESAMLTTNTRFQEMFMMNIVRLGGQGKLFSMLRKGGPLHELKWTTEWSGGLPEARGEIEDALVRAEMELRDATQEEQRKMTEMRLCPHCDQPFEVLQRNCGQFVCGRADSHTTPTNGPNGCGTTFNDSQAPYYQRNEKLLQSLRKAVTDARENAQAYEKMSTKWDQLKMSKLPLLSSHLAADKSTSFCPVSITTSAIGSDSNIIRHLIHNRTKVEQFLMLPDLIELYIWLHSTFQFIISASQATSLTLGEVMDKTVLLRRFDQTHADHILNLYQRSKEQLASHLKNCNYEVNWDCETVSIPIQDFDETPLIMVLSAYEHPTDGYDYLFIIINQLILQFNQFIFNLHGLQDLETVTPKALLHRSPAGIAIMSLKFISTFEFPLIVENYRSPNEDLYNINGLEKNLLNKLCSCSFSIDPPLNTLRSKFKFRTDIGTQPLHTQSMSSIKSSTGVLFVHQQDVQLFESCINYVKLTRSKELESTFISKFHSMEYEEMRSMLEGIRNLLQTEYIDVHSSLRELMVALIGTPDKIEEIGFPPLSKHQLELLLSLKAGQFCEVIHFFGYQLASESYNYATLPLVMKSKLDDQMTEELRTNLLSFADEVGLDRALQLLNEFRNDILSLYQSVIKDQCCKSNDNLKTYLEENNFCDDSDLIFANIPAEVTIRHHVSLCQELHQITLLLMSTDQQPYFEEDRVKDPTRNSSYTRPRRGNCWLYISRSDPEEDGASNDAKSNDNEVAGVNRGEPIGDLWFGVAQRFSESTQNILDQYNSLSSSEEASSYEFIHPDPDSNQDQGQPTNAWIELPDGSEDYVMIGDIHADEYIKHFAAKIIQRRWKSVKHRRDSSTFIARTSNVDSHLERVNHIDKQNIEGKEDDTNKISQSGNPQALSALMQFLLFFAAHMAFKFFQSLFTER